MRASRRWETEAQTVARLDRELRELRSKTLARLSAAWVSFTPSWHATTSDPVAGSSGSQFVGAYQLIAGTLHWWFRMDLGSGGSIARGSGTYQVQMPFGVHSGYPNDQSVGSGFFYKSTVASVITGVFQPVDADYTRLGFYYDGGALTNTNADAPPTDHVWIGNGTYRIA